jgi:hypothetical protein
MIFSQFQDLKFRYAGKGRTCRQLIRTGRASGNVTFIFDLVKVALPSKKDIKRKRLFDGNIIFVE